MSCTVRAEGGYRLLSPRGDLSRMTVASVRSVLDKLLFDHGRGGSSTFRSFTCGAAGDRVVRRFSGGGGWLAGCPARVDVSVLVADAVADAGLLLQTRPPRVSASRELPLSAQAPRWARSLLDTKRLDWASVAPHELAWEDATLLASELVTNAVEHAGTTSTLHVALDRLGLSVAVRDHRSGDVARPARPVPSPTPTRRGHGLVVVEPQPFLGRDRTR